jgi:predicted Fe-Mo cluster-binding NifX family protein
MAAVADEARATAVAAVVDEAQAMGVAAVEEGEDGTGEEYSAMELRRVLIPVDDDNGNIVAAHFGRAPYFVVVDLQERTKVVRKEVVPNTGEHSGGQGHAHNNVLALKPNVVIVSGMGPRGIASFQQANVAVLRADSTSVGAVLQSYMAGTLSELTEGCADAHHT